VDWQDRLIQHDDSFFRPLGEWSRSALETMAGTIGAASGAALGGGPANPAGATVLGALGFSAGSETGRQAAQGIDSTVGWLFGFGD